MRRPASCARRRSSRRAVGRPSGSTSARRAGCRPRRPDARTTSWSGPQVWRGPPVSPAPRSHARWRSRSCASSPASCSFSARTAAASPAAGSALVAVGPRPPPATCPPAAPAGRARPRARSPSPAHTAFGGLQRPAAGEDRQPPQQHPLRLGEQVVAPVHRRPQRLLARQGGPAARRQQAEAVVEPRARAARRGSARTRAAASSSASGMPSSRRQICATAAALLRRQREARAARAAPARRTAAPPRTGRALPDRRRSPARVRRARASDGTRQAVSPATPSGSRLVARMRELRAGAQQRVGQRGAGVEQVLAVVQHQQHLLRRAAPRPACRSERPPGLLAHARAPRPPPGAPAPGRPAAPAPPARRRPRRPPAPRRRAARPAASCPRPAR